MKSVLKKPNSGYVKGGDIFERQLIAPKRHTEKGETDSHGQPVKRVPAWLINHRFNTGVYTKAIMKEPKSEKSVTEEKPNVSKDSFAENRPTINPMNLDFSLKYGASNDNVFDGNLGNESTTAKTVLKAPTAQKKSDVKTDFEINMAEPKYATGNQKSGLQHGRTLGTYKYQDKYLTYDKGVNAGFFDRETMSPAASNFKIKDNVSDQDLLKHYNELDKEFTFFGLFNKETERKKEFLEKELQKRNIVVPKITFFPQSSESKKKVLK